MCNTMHKILVTQCGYRLSTNYLARFIKVQVQDLQGILGDQYREDVSSKLWYLGWELLFIDFC